ncbi:flagellar basal body-associated FliL family protein [Terriglobus saanensis]|uniref:Flagellar protein FliL n=1 Tax=Terriglobus saanensis (strain ATCC BAA-1853 / DSM 23119 / SP1PR4) TaxID=401053 RepID=E8V4Z8_TERSS|nr:flagellar basal body-associated FliL family protein [Terriglobus saanensis]ADV82626.1 flagellar basal body-associated protein FliL [Terriglobus saanensis SP1PR4]
MNKDASANASGQPAKINLGSLLIVAIVAAVLSAGGAAAVFYFLAKRMGVSPFSETKTFDSRQGAAQTKQVPFEPMLVNLADSDGQAYLRLGVVLSVLDEPEKAGKEKVDAAHPVYGSAAMRDTILSVVGAEKSGDLLMSSGKSALKTKLRSAIQQRDPALKIADVFFTEFLVQR